MPNSDMYFAGEDNDQFEYGPQNTMYTSQFGQYESENGLFNSQQVSGYVPSARELQFFENQQ